MNELLAEHAIWLAREYPDQHLVDPIFGMVEEAGELLHVLLKLKQEQMRGPDPRYPNLRADLVDAVGDCGIYVLSYCNTKRIAVPAERYSTVIRANASSLQHATALIQEAVHMTQAPHSLVHLAFYLSLLEHIAGLHGLDLLQCMRVTWDTVKERKQCA